MKKLLTLSIIILAFAIGAQAQETVTLDQKTADACSKAFDTVDAQDKQIAALKSEIKAKENESAAKDTVIKLQSETIELFRKLKCEKTSFLFGIVSVKKCY